MISPTELSIVKPFETGMLYCMKTSTLEALAKPQQQAVEMPSLL